MNYKTGLVKFYKDNYCKFINKCIRYFKKYIIYTFSNIVKIINVLGGGFNNTIIYLYVVYILKYLLHEDVCKKIISRLHTKI